MCKLSTLYFSTSHFNVYFKFNFKADNAAVAIYDYRNEMRKNYLPTVIVNSIFSLF